MLTAAICVFHDRPVVAGSGAQGIAGRVVGPSGPVVVGVWQHQPLYLRGPIVETGGQTRARQPAAEFIFAMPEPGPALNELGGDRAYPVLRSTTFTKRLSDTAPASAPKPSS